ncbi:cystathionine beta-lyase [Yoonia sp.]|uniref:cystathionine beta-lyase n=1 Tax=Yoonia sp. TaxID=2212373 RepID=UPI0023A1CC48|nr:cystathionine beta-lyase [Yoonia sp.]MDE0852162.1 cystathionine beta-lyase [Yoonia sp.]
MDWRTKLLDPKPQARQDYASLATPVYRGSTVVFDDQAAVTDDWRQADKGYSYGLYGTPTTLELASRIAGIEGARETFIVPGGQAAIALIYLAYCQAGSHALVPHSAYGPNKAMAEGLMRGLNVEVEPYDPMIGAGISDLIRENTALIWCESPGSVTMEIQDVPAIVKAAHAKDVAVALDNTYAAGVMFDAFAHGVDVSMQALTKYVGGHSDLLLGSVSARDDAAYAKLGPIYQQLGLAVSPDDCSLALRGLQTLAVRLDALEKATLQVANWLTNHPQIDEVYHPALPSCPGHDVWARDFKGSTSVFSFTFKDTVSATKVVDFINALTVFKIGMSWGGINSLAVVYPNLQRPDQDFGGRIVRLNIGLEAPDDLIADLDQATKAL